MIDFVVICCGVVLVKSVDWPVQTLPFHQGEVALPGGIEAISAHRDIRAGVQKDAAGGDPADEAVVHKKTLVDADEAEGDELFLELPHGLPDGDGFVLLGKHKPLRLADGLGVYKLHRIEGHGAAAVARQKQTMVSCAAGGGVFIQQGGQLLIKAAFPQEGPGMHPEDLIDLVLHIRHIDDVRLTAPGPQLLPEADAVRAGHLDVEKDEIEGQVFQHCGEFLGGVCLKAVAFKVLGEEDTFRRFPEQGAEGCVVVAEGDAQSIHLNPPPCTAWRPL